MAVRAALHSGSWYSSSGKYINVNSAYRPRINKSVTYSMCTDLKVVHSFNSPVINPSEVTTKVWQAHNVTNVLFTTVHKGGAKDNPSNYRPIAVVPIFANIWKLSWQLNCPITLRPTDCIVLIKKCTDITYSDYQLYHGLSRM